MTQNKYRTVSYLSNVCKIKLKLPYPYYPCTNAVSWLMEHDIPYYHNKGIIRFQNKEDAALYKLMWL